MSDALITLTGVSVHLAGHAALRDVDWELRPGEHWAFTGANGSGKSTLLRVIRGDQYIDPDGGRRVYRFDGAERGAMAARAFIGIVSPEQHERYARLELPIAGRVVIESGFDDSLYVHRPLAAAEARAVDRVIEELDLGEFIDRPIHALSFGQLRRLLIARALVRRPRALVLDEYTSGLDAASRATVRALVDRLAATVHLIVASHRDDDVVPAITHHARLEAGRIVARGRTPIAVPGAVVPAVTIAPPDGEPLVSIAHADVYRGATRVLHDLTWAIRRGEHTAIVGQNGSGKSTFAAVVAGTLAPAYGGEIRRSGRGGPFNLWRIKESIAHVSEEWQIGYAVDHTVADVVVSGFVDSVGLFHVPTGEQRERAADLLAELDLDALGPRPFSQLSFGERRKVLLARALVRPPAILILDEVWNGLDRAFRARLRDVLDRRIAMGTTLLTIAHEPGDEPSFITRRQRLAGGTLHDD
jgi:molybdate transport system ATP-binding protein